MIAGLSLRLKSVAANLKHHVVQYVESFADNPLRYTDGLRELAIYNRDAMNALAEIINLQPRMIRVWNPDQYKAEYIPAIDARTIVDIIKQYGLTREV